jgi:16S rRNA (adenine1518-N6/adenine1519-N6)-dimethyltransferase
MRQRLGQHFLKDQTALRRIVRALSPQRGEIIIEIGSGHGELTRPLLESIKEAGAEFIAIEKDEQLADTLAAEYEIDVRKGDARILLPKIVSGLKGRPFSAVGNIPYYLTGRLFRILGELKEYPRQTVLTVQKEVAERLIATPPRMNRLSASVQFWAKPKIIGKIGKNSFSPPPEVDSAIVLLEARALSKEENGLREAYGMLIGKAFAQPRKTVINNLLGKKTEFRETLVSLLISAGIPPENRPQDLSRDNLLTLAKLLPHKWV